MKIHVRHMLKKTRAGGYAQRDEVIEAPSIRFGRGAECEVHLTDPRILLHHLEMTERPGGLFLESTGGLEFQVNGKLMSAAAIKPGDAVQIGPYDVTVLGAEAGYDGAFSLEYARPLGDELAALKARSNTRLTRAGLGIRGWAWLLFFIAVAVGIGAPLSTYLTTPRGVDPMSQEMRDTTRVTLDKIWSPGPMTGVHAHFGDQCGTCHVNAFEKVQNTVCSDCHEDAGHHADPQRFSVASLDGLRCATCHKEHTGAEEPVIAGERFCTDCHSELSSVASNSDLKDVGGFEAHPQFRPTVVASDDPHSFERIALDAETPPVDRSNLNFPHDKHLNPKGVRSPTGEPAMLSCGDCHVPETGGVAMLPVRFEDNCAGCHKLQFEPQAPDRTIPHGDVAAAKLFVEDTYAAIALRGGFEAEEADAPAVIRRLIGSPVTETERQEALQWATQKASEVLDSRFGRGLCAQCHTVREEAMPRDWSVAPVHLTKRWLPKGYFTHDAHRDRSCTTCHAAPDSDTARDVLLPEIAVCQDCHGGELATNKVRTACTACHGFHQENPMPDRTTAQSGVWE